MGIRIFKTIFCRPRKRRSDVPRARLRYYLHDGSSAFRFKLSGPLAGEDVADLEQCWRTAQSIIGSKRFLVDLSDLTTADGPGRELLHLLAAHGAKFVGTSGKTQPLIASIMGNAFHADHQRAS